MTNKKIFDRRKEVDIAQKENWKGSDIGKKEVKQKYKTDKQTQKEQKKKE